MSVIAAAVIGSTVVGVGAAVASSSATKNAAKQSAQVSRETTDQNLKLQRELEDKQRQDLEPWRKAGEKALKAIETGIAKGTFDVKAFNAKFNAPVMGEVDVTQDPSYKFRLKEGQKALDNSASARGNLLSGQQLKATTQYNQDYASTEYGKAYARAVDEYNRKYGAEVDRYGREVDAYARDANEKIRKYNMLSNLANAGGNAAAKQATITGNLAEVSGRAITNNGINQMNAYQQVGNANSQMYGDIAQSVNGAAQNWLTYKLNTPAANPKPNPYTPYPGYVN